MKEEIYIGIDLGATKILTGAINAGGQILSSPVKLPTGADGPGDETLARVIQSVEGVLRDLECGPSQISGIGIGSTGPLDNGTGMILENPQLPHMNFFPLRDSVSKHFNLPVRLNNDANCFLLAESLFGAGAGKQTVLGFTLGTGIGCALVLDGRIHNGATGTAGEIWCSPFGKSFVEATVSGSGLTSMYKDLTGTELSGLQLFEQATKGDANALTVWDQFGAHLATPFSWAINVLDPEIVIIGGSLANASEFFMPSLLRTLRPWINSVPAEKLTIVPPSLGDAAGFIGAAALFLANNGKTN